jgi:hypothetical protein
MLVIGKPRIPAVLPTLAGILFGATHVPPAGPLGVACFIGAAAYLEWNAASEGKKHLPSEMTAVTPVKS